MIVFDRVEKSFGEQKVLRALSLSVRPGEVYTLLGQNGAGKTTAIKILCGLLDSDAGEVTVQGQRIGEDTRRVLGVAPQEISLYRELTCEENLVFFAELYGLDRRTQKQRVASVMSWLGLEPWKGRPVGQLSGGWQRRMNLAVALVPEPKVLVLDEPTAGLDTESRRDLWRLIMSLRSSGVSILLTTHLLDEAEHLSDRVGILRDGRLGAEGSLEELKDQIGFSQVAVVECLEELELVEIARAFGWKVRTDGESTVLWIPKRLEFQEVVDRLQAVKLGSLSLHEIDLDQIYREFSGVYGDPGEA